MWVGDSFLVNTVVQISAAGGSLCTPTEARSLISQEVQLFLIAVVLIFLKQLLCISNATSEANFKYTIRYVLQQLNMQIWQGDPAMLKGDPLI